MENKNCGIVRDLMPLVIDEVASEESRTLVARHVEECAACSDILKRLRMRTDDLSSAAQQAEEKRALEAAAAKLRRRQLLRKLRFVLLGALTAGVMLFAALLGYDRLIKMTLPVEPDAYGISLAQLEDGRVVFSADYRGSNRSMYTNIRQQRITDPDTKEEKDVLFVEMETYLLANRMVTPMQNGSFLLMTETDMNSIDEIRSGTTESYEVLWRTGDAMKPASDEMEEYFLWEKMREDLWGAAVESADGKAGFPLRVDATRYSLINAQMQSLRTTVPEWQPWYGPKAEMLDEGTIDWLIKGSE